MMPYAQIIETGDRRWSLRLLERLRCPDVTDEELDDLASALGVLSDPRVWPGLLAVLADRGLPERTRRAAGSIERGLDWSPDTPDDVLTAWWEHGDAVLRQHALLSMELCRPDIVLQVARDPTHELHATAIAGMAFFLDRPEHQDVKIAALDHPDAEVRQNAAYVLLWDEPIAAVPASIRLTDDPVPAVAAEACRTLAYYPSRQVALCLRERSMHGPDEVRDAALRSFDAIRDDFLDCLTAPRVRGGMGIRHLLDQPQLPAFCPTRKQLSPRFCSRSQEGPRVYGSAGS